MEWLWEGLSIGIGVAIALTLFVKFRKPMPFDQVAARNRTAFVVNRDPQDAINAVIDFAKNSKYKLREVDQANNRLVLEEMLSFFTFGTVFEVVVKPVGPGQSTIHVATVGMLYQRFWAFNRSKQKFIDALQAALSARPVTA